jgi:hypothetical protein
MSDDDDGLDAAIDRAREVAETSLDPWDWRKLHALEAVKRAREDRVLLDALSEPDPGVPFPPWSEVSEPGTSEGPIPF